MLNKVLSRPATERDLKTKKAFTQSAGATLLWLAVVFNNFLFLGRTE